MAVQQKRYRIWIRGLPGTCIPQYHDVERPSDGRARWAAVVWLRSVRTAVANGDRYTQWALYALNNRGTQGALIAEGDQDA